MAVGFKVYDPATGAVRVDGTKRIVRLAQTAYLAAGTSGSIVNDVFLTGSPFAFCTMLKNDSGFTFPYAGLYPPQITVIGNTLFYNNVGATHRLMYGSF